MKRISRIIGFVLVVCLSFLLVACSSESKEIKQGRDAQIYISNEIKDLTKSSKFLEKSEKDEITEELDEHISKLKSAKTIDELKKYSDDTAGYLFMTLFYVGSDKAIENIIDKAAKKYPAVADEINGLL